MSRLAAPKGFRVLYLGPLSLLCPLRPALAALGLVAATMLVSAFALVAGSGGVGLVDAVAALVGGATDTTRLLIWGIRMPRVVAALLAGASLGLAGALIQALARNRLATPEILGLNEGAALAMLVAVSVSSSGMLGPWWVAPLGAALTAVILLVLAGDVGTRGYRVLIVGLAVGSVLHAVVELVLSRQSIQHASAVYAWSIGSLGGRDFSAAGPVAMTLAVLLPVSLAAGRLLGLLRLSEDVAATLGLRVRLFQALCLLLAVALAGFGVGVGGPIGFVALVAPLLATGLAGRAHLPLLGAALAGALLVVSADTLGRVVASPAEIPAGVVTSVLGGPVLLWLVIRGGTAREI